MNKHTGILSRGRSPAGSGLLGPASCVAQDEGDTPESQNRSPDFLWVPEPPTGAPFLERPPQPTCGNPHTLQSASSLPCVQPPSLRSLAWLSCLRPKVWALETLAAADVCWGQARPCSLTLWREGPAP